MDQKAHIYAVEVFSTASSHSNTADLNEKGISKVWLRGCSDSASVERVVGTRTGEPIARKSTRTDKSPDGLMKVHASSRHDVGVGVQQVKVVDK
jgi:hypothetical protein